MRYCFDTSALNRLLDDPDREALVCAFLASGFVRITAYNVVEAAKTSDRSRRTALLGLFCRLANGYRFLDRPNTLVRAAARAFSERSLHETVSVTVNGDPNLDGLWVALNEPDEIDEEIRAELLEWAEHWEAEFDEIVAGERANVQQILRAVPGSARRAADTIRSYVRNMDQVLTHFLGPIFERETGKTLSTEEFADLMVEPIWGLYLGGYAYGMHSRSVRMQGFSRKRVAGGFDLGQAVYLRFCDRFITNDVAQYRALRLLNRLHTNGRPEVLMYNSFRERIVLPSFTRPLAAAATPQTG